MCPKRQDPVIHSAGHTNVEKSGCVLNILHSHARSTFFYLKVAGHARKTFLSDLPKAGHLAFCT